jgi:hypothetical protein
MDFTMLVQHDPWLAALAVLFGYLSVCALVWILTRDL